MFRSILSKEAKSEHIQTKAFNFFDLIIQPMNPIIISECNLSIKRGRCILFYHQMDCRENMMFQWRTCESLFPCLFSMGIAAGSCGGFLSICCVKPATVNRWLNDNRINDEVNGAFKKAKKERVLNDPKCGIRPTANRRVIDGSDAGFGTFPWQALIRIGKAKAGLNLRYSTL